MQQPRYFGGVENKSGWSGNAMVISYLAQRGLVFINGIPPQSEDGTLLIWTGGCNALVARWHKNELLRWDNLKPIEAKKSTAGCACPSFNLAIGRYAVCHDSRTGFICGKI